MQTQQRPSTYLENNASPYWIGRVARFSAQMFPLYPNVIIFIAQFWIHSLLLEKLLSPDSMSWPIRLCGALSSVLFVYMFRVFDELKDYPTDLINFPDRPLVKGVMNIPDAHRLWMFSVVILVLLQLIINQPLVWISFSIVMAFSFLAFKWFFMESVIRPSLPMALITHNPILYIYQIYLLSFFTLPWSDNGWIPFVYLIGDAISGTAWEISRKIRGIKQEDTYTTYSKIWGRGRSLSLVLILMMASTGLSIYGLQSLSQNSVWVYFMPGILITLHLAITVLKFLKNPQTAPSFKAWVEVFKFSLLLSYFLVWMFT